MTLLSAVFVLSQIPAEAPTVLIDGKPQRIVALHGMPIKIQLGGAIGLSYLLENHDKTERLAAGPVWRDLVKSSEGTAERFRFPSIRVALTLDDGRYVVIDAECRLAVLPRGSQKMDWWKGVSRKITKAQSESIDRIMRRIDPTRGE